MDNHTKYRIKPEREFSPLLTDDMAILVCGKCFKKFISAEEDEYSALLRLAEKSGKRILSCMQVDFLCNKPQTAKKLPALLPNGTKSILVAACGLGIQTVAELIALPVIAAADSVGAAGHPGMALTKSKCNGCAQCYLNLTGGICPVVDCAKGLLNGQCGGAKNGKCEVHPEKDCAWEKIEARLEKQGRLHEFITASVQLRDYSKVNIRSIRTYVNSIREKRTECGYGGVHPLERKERSGHLSLENFPVPAEVVIPLSQHIGALAKPLVQAGEYVKLGQKIGEAAGFVSANVHASVSGTIAAVEDRPHPTLGTCLSIVISSDEKDIIHESIKGVSDPQNLTPHEIIEIIREKGVVGMGGAAFPTAAKLNTDKKIDTVLLNGCECESVLTADHQVMLRYADEVILGLKLMMKAVGAEKGIIAIEDNKPDAAVLLRKKTENDISIELSVLKTRYPQGAEKVLIRRVLGREVPRGGLPADAGVVVCNVSTAKAVADAVIKGMPPVARAVTVSGEKVKKPANFMVRIGTSAKALLEHCGLDEGAAVKMGGAMMGTLLTETDVPVMKGTGGVIAVEMLPRQSSACIKCGRCADVCPMELSPLCFAKYAQEEKWAGVKAKNITDCIECGCCEYICPSGISLVTWIKAGKKAVRELT